MTSGMSEQAKHNIRKIAGATEIVDHVRKSLGEDALAGGADVASMKYMLDRLARTVLMLERRVNELAEKEANATSA